MIDVPENVVKNLREYYKTLIEKSGTTILAKGRNSSEYALALALVTALIETVNIAYDFNDSRAAHYFLAEFH